MLPRTAQCEEKPPWIRGPGGSVWCESRRHPGKGSTKEGKKSGFTLQDERLSKQNTKHVQRHNAHRDKSSIMGC